MQGGQVAVEGPVLRLASVLTPSKPKFFPSLTKVVGTLGPNSRSVEVIEACLEAGMSVARFDFSWLDENYHQETLDNLRVAVKNVKRLCAVMLDTMGPALQVRNKSGNPIELMAGNQVTITPDVTREPSAEILPVNYLGLANAVIKGDTIFVGQYLFTGIETTSIWLEVLETRGKDILCLVKNSATLQGSIFTMHASQVHIDLPTLTDVDRQAISNWGSRNKVDFISLSYTRHVEDVRELRAFIKAQNLHETQIFAKVETVEGLRHFDDILEEADGIILSRGNLGIDLPPEKVFLFQKSAIHRCNMIGKPVIITRVVDSMTANLRPTRAEATDVANAVLDGADGILLGPETLRGMYPIEAIKTVGRICAEAEVVCNQSLQFKRVAKHVGEPMSHAESVASSAVHTATKVKAAMIVVFTSSGGAARLIAKYRPSVPVFAVVIPRLSTNSLKWTFTGSSQARQLLGVRGVYPILASPNVATSGGSSEESGLKLALDHGKTMGLLKPNDQVVVFQKIGDSSVVKIVVFQDQLHS
ncbi:pyruvate kinase 2, cytosolic-like [Rhododendron vialii]|uniref:pyruvate kinase 2, cytosolic-like n=1 Tax=Rhododendron vialii TaxID=182163 RepID=UPI00265F7CF2|nr:pyruvate kinase 2, cytosolic-like [Rhododendron vialii]